MGSPGLGLSGHHPIAPPSLSRMVLRAGNRRGVFAAAAQAPVGLVVRTVVRASQVFRVTRFVDKIAGHFLGIVRIECAFGGRDQPHTEAAGEERLVVRQHCFVIVVGSYGHLGPDGRFRISSRLAGIGDPRARSLSALGEASTSRPPKSDLQAWRTPSLNFSLRLVRVIGVFDCVTKSKAATNMSAQRFDRLKCLWKCYRIIGTFVSWTQETNVPRINPLRLRHYRAKQNLSQDDLASQSGIDKGTIFRIESGKTKRNGIRVVNALAKSLKIEPAQLTAADMDGIETPTEEFFPKTQLNMRITAEVRNALALVSLRYGVKPAEVIEFAPLLFHLAASESLQDRATRLESLRQARASVEAFSGRFKHITERLVSDWDAENLETMEARSIATRDLRGVRLDDGDAVTDSRPLEYDDDEGNPFVVHLQERLKAVQGDAADRLEGWYSYAGVRYEICREQALEWFGGDEVTADDFVSGRYSISDMPREIRAAEPAERVAWAMKKRIEIEEHSKAYLESLGLESPI